MQGSGGGIIFEEVGGAGVSVGVAWRINGNEQVARAHVSESLDFGGA